MFMGLPKMKCFRVIKKSKMEENETKCFKKIIENVGVNRAPAWIRQPGRGGDSGRDTFENKKFNKSKQNVSRR